MTSYLDFKEINSQAEDRFVFRGLDDIFSLFKEFQYHGANSRSIPLSGPWTPGKPGKWDPIETGASMRYGGYGDFRRPQTMKMC
ncbi:MAG TPA: hypothetical protein DCS07_03415 [Bdellovibrionales bacterium]|nr:MAG: hypothetical protein A2Z97_11270 [Bdellovibrionales bacterium GWB1_52_6]OFZ05180.1 MAG: hypothetical protein A2X97_10325 [Bdellovibrionales bacterium GWA1_52_35]OFZ39260.1 MAG: hypothetical protein A2070_13200 [Bdellovibrionales bacterium GWC1_52_8]HAR41667.1 hypothetical protein [Bdellovibrionales bacterium]HCM38690.1 hypothetical protein [Bdellovibrionales bacterium]